MAEVIGLVASVIQVAGAGLKLSQTLYIYAEGVASADRRIKDIAKEIELTSFVIEELGSIFKQDGTSAVISKNAVKTANETMKECSTVFAEIDASLKKSKKNTLGRLMLPFRDNKIELLRNHIDKLKSTLQLLMQVLSHAHQVASNKLDREAEVKQREQIKELLDLKKKSTKRYEESLKNFSISDGSTMIDDDVDSDKENDDAFSTSSLKATAASIASTINADTLGKCVQHIKILLEDIETLQQALSGQVDGDDHSEHHQSLVGSYFRARGHLDSVLFGSTKGHGPSYSRTPTLKSEVSRTESERGGGLGTTSTAPIDLDALRNEAMAKARAEVELEFLKRSEALREQEEATKAAAATLAEKEAKEHQARPETEKARESNKAKPPEKIRQPPIKFKNAQGKQYIVPFDIAKTWKDFNNFIQDISYPDMTLINQIEALEFDLLDNDGNIIMPKYWASTIEPGYVVSLQLWQTSAPSTRIEGATVHRSDKVQLTESVVDYNDPKAHGVEMSSHLEMSEDERKKVLQSEIDAITAVMQDNINKVMERGERLDDLQSKTDGLAASASAFRRAAKKQPTYWDSVRGFFSPQSVSEETRVPHQQLPQPAAATPVKTLKETHKRKSSSNTRPLYSGDVETPASRSSEDEKDCGIEIEVPDAPPPRRPCRLEDVLMAGIQPAHDDIDFGDLGGDDEDSEKDRNKRRHSIAAPMVDEDEDALERMMMEGLAGGDSSDESEEVESIPVPAPVPLAIPAPQPVPVFVQPPPAFVPVPTTSSHHPSHAHDVEVSPSPAPATKIKASERTERRSVSMSVPKRDTDKPKAPAESSARYPVKPQTVRVPREAADPASKERQSTPPANLKARPDPGNLRPSAAATELLDILLPEPRDQQAGEARNHGETLDSDSTVHKEGGLISLVSSKKPKARGLISRTFPEDQQAPKPSNQAVGSGSAQLPSPESEGRARRERLRPIEERRKVLRRNKTVDRPDSKKIAANVDLDTSNLPDFVPALPKEETKLQAIVEEALKQSQEVKSTSPKTTGTIADPREGPPHDPEMEKSRSRRMNSLLRYPNDTIYQRNSDTDLSSRADTPRAISQATLRPPGYERWSTSMRRTRSTGEAPAPNVTIYNTTRMDNESNPNVRTEQCDRGDNRSAQRGRRIPLDWDLEDEINELKLELRRNTRARSRSRPDIITEQKRSDLPPRSRDHEFNDDEWGAKNESPPPGGRKYEFEDDDWHLKDEEITHKKRGNEGSKIRLERRPSTNPLVDLQLLDQDRPSQLNTERGTENEDNPEKGKEKAYSEDDEWYYENNEWVANAWNDKNVNLGQDNAHIRPLKLLDSSTIKPGYADPKQGTATDANDEFLDEFLAWDHTVQQPSSPRRSTAGTNDDKHRTGEDLNESTKLASLDPPNSGYYDPKNPQASSANGPPTHAYSHYKQQSPNVAEMAKHSSYASMQYATEGFAGMYYDLPTLQDWSSVLPEDVFEFEPTRQPRSRDGNQLGQKQKHITLPASPGLSGLVPYQYSRHPQSPLGEHFDLDFVTYNNYTTAGRMNFTSAELRTVRSQDARYSQALPSSTLPLGSSSNTPPSVDDGDSVFPIHSKWSSLRPVSVAHKRASIGTEHRELDPSPEEGDDSEKNQDDAGDEVDALLRDWTTVMD